MHLLKCVIYHSESSKNKSENAQNTRMFQVLFLNNNPVNINETATLDEGQSFPFQDIKEKQNRHRRAKSLTSWNQYSQTQNTITRE